MMDGYKAIKEDVNL